jgi:hypothetical protein
MKEKEITKLETCNWCAYKYTPKGCFTPCSICRKGDKFKPLKSHEKEIHE